MPPPFPIGLCLTADRPCCSAASQATAYKIEKVLFLFCSPSNFGAFLRLLVCSDKAAKALRKYAVQLQSRACHLLALGR